MLSGARKELRDEDPELQSIMESGMASVDWVGPEFSGVRLGDVRLDKRLMKTATLLAKSPGSPINEACRTWAETQGAYRLFDNPRTEAEAILRPHVKATAERIEGIEGPVLVVQDTVFFSYGQHPKTRGLGPIGKSNATHDRGLIAHHALAFTTTGVPLGILSQQIWARDPVPEGEGYQEKIERLQVTPIEEKESFKWLKAQRETHERVSARGKLITVADRESDLWEFLTEAKETRQHFLIRSRVDRILVPEDSECQERLVEALASALLSGTQTVNVPGNGRRKARTAQLEVRVAEVTFKAPNRRAQVKGLISLEPLTVTAIQALEAHPPTGEEPLAWVLLTDLKVGNFASACEKIDWYGHRFGIETWHKVLKSGCEVEECMLEHADRLKPYLALFSIIGVRLMHVAYLARVQPDLPATEVFSNEEIEALHVRVKKTLTPKRLPTVRDMVRMIGNLGGHLGRKCDKEPGMTVFWRGWMRFYEDVVVLANHREILGLKGPS